MTECHTKVDITSSSEDTSSSVFPTSSPSITTTIQVVTKKDRLKRLQPRIISLERHLQPPKSLLSEQTCIDKSSNSSDLGNNHSPSSLAPSDDEYSRKFENLRDEVGDEWLRVLGQSEFGERESEQYQETITGGSSGEGSSRAHCQ